MFLKILALDRTFRELPNDVSYVGLSENFIISTFLKYMEKFGDFTECIVLGSLQIDL